MSARSSTERQRRTSPSANIPEAPSDQNYIPSSFSSSQTAPNVASVPSRKQRLGLVNNEEMTLKASYRSRSPTSSIGTASDISEGTLSPGATDRVFPIRSFVSVDPTPTPSLQRSARVDGYFASHGRRTSSRQIPPEDDGQDRTPREETNHTKNAKVEVKEHNNNVSTANEQRNVQNDSQIIGRGTHGVRTSEQGFQVASDTATSDSTTIHGAVEGRLQDDEHIRGKKSPRMANTRSGPVPDDGGGLYTSRFKHVITDGGHAVITGRDGETLQRCEDEPIHIPGAVQGFGLLIALHEESEGKLTVRIVSENSWRIIGYTPKQLFMLESFTDILSEAQTDNLLDHIDFIKDESSDVQPNGPEVFTISIRNAQRKAQKLWCAIHINDKSPNLIICEFELEDDPVYPLVPSQDETPEPPEDTLNSVLTQEEYKESTETHSRPLRVLRSARKRKGEAAAMEVFNVMSQVQEQLTTAPNLDQFLKVLVGVVKELTGFHRVMIYQFDHAWNGRVVTELVDPRATKDLYKGLNFPASDIPKQARDMYKLNKVRLLYDRDHETARLVCRTMEDLETPLDLTYSYLRAMSPIHIKYLANMAVRSSMSISINAFGELWGLIACHCYGSKGTRVSFPIRKMCRLVGDSASRNIERLSYASRLQARKLINTASTQHNPSGYIIASSEDLINLFIADFGLLSIRGETKILGKLEATQECLALLEYLRVRKFTTVMSTQDIRAELPDLRYVPGFQVVAGLLIVPLSVTGSDFIVFFRKGQLREVKWAGNPYEKYVKEGTEGYLEPRKSFKTWSETIFGKCREWTEEEIETAAVLCLVYGKFIDVWRQKEAALQNTQLTKLLLANSAHEVRTPLNAIINYLEIALEGNLDQETRENLAKSHSASKSLIYVINDLLDLTKTEAGTELVHEEVFDLKTTFREAVEAFKGDAKRKQITFEVMEHPGLPDKVIGDQRRVRQAISNVTANAIQATTRGDVKVEISVVGRRETHINVEVVVQDTGVGMSAKKLDALFAELEQAQSEPEINSLINEPTNPASLNDGTYGKQTLGLGLAIVARIVRNMDGQLRLKSEEGKGSRFVIQFPLDLPTTEPIRHELEDSMANNLVSPPEPPTGSSPVSGERMLINKSEARLKSTVDIVPNMPRRNSGASINSIASIQSAISVTSNASAKSDVDRMIEAITEPLLVEKPASRNRASIKSGSGRSLFGRGSLANQIGSSGRDISQHSESVATQNVPEYLRSSRPHTPGQQNILDSRTPLRAIRVPDDDPLVSLPTTKTDLGSQARTLNLPRQLEHKDEPLTADHMRVLVAEDDPINSRIMQKRLEKAGHETYMTVNGEECASAYGERAAYFDLILMDIQVCQRGSLRFH